MRRTTESSVSTAVPQHPQRQRILDALEKLHEVCECWDEDEVGAYPPDLPSFDEFVAEVSGKLLAIDWRSLTHCRTCGSEIVETINDSLFRDGECGGCEERRYTSHAALLAAACTALDAMNDLAAAVGDAPTWNAGGSAFEAREQLTLAISGYDHDRTS